MSTWKKVLTTGNPVGDMSNVDTTGVVTNDVLMYDGGKFVVAPAETNFIFRHTDDKMTSNHQTLDTHGETHLIGPSNSAVPDSNNSFTVSGTLINWNDELANSITHGEILVSNGNVDSSNIGSYDASESGVTLTSGYNSVTNLTTYTFTIDYSSNAAHDIQYPDISSNTSTTGPSISFTAQNLGDGTSTINPTTALTASLGFYFANYVYFGKTSGTVASIDSEAEVEALSYSVITNNLGTTGSSTSKLWTSGTHNINAGTGERYIFAVPSRLVTATNTLNFVDNDTGIGIDITEGGTVSVTNTAGYQEDYKIYGTTETGLGALNIKTRR